MAEPKTDHNRYLCLACGHIAEVGPDDVLKGCPSCGDAQGIPADWNDRRSVLITAHELRVLVMWAEFWASVKDDAEHARMRQVLHGIADRLQLQHMDWPSLTFAGELADLRSEFGTRVAQNVIIERKPDGENH